MVRPEGQNENQKSCYPSHKQLHCLVNQTLTTPDGLIFALHWPIECRRHDLASYEEVVGIHSLNLLLLWEKTIYLYGGSAYTLRCWMQRPFDGVLDDAKRNFNAQISSVRVSVEHNYKDRKQTSLVIWCYEIRLLLFCISQELCFGTFGLAFTQEVNHKGDTKSVLHLLLSQLQIYSSFFDSILSKSSVAFSVSTRLAWSLFSSSHFFT